VLVVVVIVVVEVEGGGGGRGRGLAAAGTLLLYQHVYLLSVKIIKMHCLLLYILHPL
jgi:hypothetical protein